jgi:hypothetical protein
VGVRVVMWRVRRHCWVALMGVAASTSMPQVSPNVGSHGVLDGGGSGCTGWWWWVMMVVVVRGENEWSRCVT